MAKLKKAKKLTKKEQRVLSAQRFLSRVNVTGRVVKPVVVKKKKVKRGKILKIWTSKLKARIHVPRDPSRFTERKYPDEIESNNMRRYRNSSGENKMKGRILRFLEQFNPQKY